MPIRTIAVQLQTDCVKPKFYVVTRDSNGAKLVDSKSFGQLTARQKRMVRREAK